MLSMSMCVDNSQSSQHQLTIRPRMPSMWIPDERVSTCFNCTTPFSFFRRKHHCRSCGRIFCRSCSAHREKMPGKTVQRVCAACAQLLQAARAVDWLITALSVMPISFPDLFSVRLLNKEWNSAVNLLLGMYRGLQYRLPCQKYSKIESNFLITHFQEFTGHVSWQIHGIMAMHQAGRLLLMGVQERLHCRTLLCSRICVPFLSIADIIRLIPVLHVTELQRWVVQTWQHMNPKLHCLLMFWWVHIGLQHPRLVQEGLLELCKCRLELAYAFWFECNLAKNKVNFKQLIDFQTCLCAKLKKSWLLELKKSIRLREMLSQLAQKRRQPPFFTHSESVRLPWAPHIAVCKMGKMKRVISSSNPISISFQTTQGQIIQCLLKNEDVRTDRLSMVIGHLINDMTKVMVHTYPVFPLTSTSGCISMIPQAQTLYSIRKSMSLTNYIMSTNAQDTIQNVRHRFVSTAAGACLLAFTMGLGDRHLENILVTDNAHLVHVDFGYILGEDPKHMQSSMRITDDMVDAMGGRTSESFTSFLAITKQGYAAMRLHSSLWYQLLSSEYLIFQDKKRSLLRIEQHVYNRFVPGEWNDEASLHIESVVKSATHTSWAQHAVDAVHNASNHFNTLLQPEV